MAYRGILKPLEPDDSISCVGEEGFKSTWLTRPELDRYYCRNQANTQPPPPRESTRTSSKSSSKRRSSMSSDKRKIVSTTTTYRAPLDDLARYVGDSGAALPSRSHSRKHSSSKHSVIVVEKESSHKSSTTKSSSSRPLPPRSNDRFYDHHLAEPKVSHKRTSSIPDRRSSSVPLKVYGRDRGSSSGLDKSFWSLKVSSLDMGSWSGSGRRRNGSGGSDDVRHESRRRSSAESRSYVKMPEYYESHGDRKPYCR